MASSGYYQPGRQGVAQEFLAQPPQQPGNQVTVGNVSFPKAASAPGGTTVSKDEALKKFFGQPRSGFFDTTSTYDEYDVENFDLPDGEWCGLCDGDCSLTLLSSANMHTLFFAYAQLTVAPTSSCASS